MIMNGILMYLLLAWLDHATALFLHLSLSDDFILALDDLKELVLDQDAVNRLVEGDSWSCERVINSYMHSGGAILGGSTSWSLLRMSYYFWTSDLGIELGSSVLFIAGALLCLPTCWLATLVPYNPKSLSLLATLMTLATVGMLMLSLGMTSIGGLSRALREPSLLNSSMLRAMAQDAFDPAVCSSFAAMQIELKCCGVQSYSDWHNYRRAVPPSCCGRVWNGKNGDQCNVPLYANGCLRPALLELRSYANSLSVLASAIIVVMAVTLFTAAYTLVTGVVERDGRAKPSGGTMRVACLAHSPRLVTLPAPAPPQRL